jgi:hypothetical protein
MGVHIPIRRELRSKAIVHSTKYSATVGTLGRFFGWAILCLAGVVGAALGISVRLFVSLPQLVGAMGIAHIGLLLLVSRYSGVPDLIPAPRIARAFSVRPSDPR